jgi:RHS repeat-associated protein
LAFTDQNQDTVKNSWPTNLYDFMLREYRTGHGRWTSPDPSGLAAVNPSNPQSWNRYAYVLNNPMSLIDPFGDDCYDMGGNSIGADTPGSCAASGGNWWDPNTNTWTVPGQSVTVPETQDLVVQEVAVVNPTSLLAQELLTSGPNPANNGNNNSILTPQQQKALYCVGQAAAAKGVSIALDVAGSIPVFGNLVSGATATIQGLNAGYYGTVALANAGNTLLNPSASGAVSTAATVGLTVGSLALSGSKVIPALGTAVSLVALGYDAIKAVQVYKQCMAGPG